MFLAGLAWATMATVEGQEAQRKYVGTPSERFLLQRAVPSRQKLSANSIIGITQGIDSNPLLDSTKKADGYFQETAGMHFQYPVWNPKCGVTNSRFGFDLTNVNYYRITDVNILDNTAYAGLEQELFDSSVSVGVGYGFEFLLFPNSRDGTFIGNEVIASIKQKITKRIHHKFTYRMLVKNFTSRKAMLGIKVDSSKLREDFRNTLDYGIALYPTDITKLKITNQLYFNNSNDQYYDYYDYLNYRLGVSIVQFFNPKFYTITGFYYQRRNYDSRLCSDEAVVEKDNQYVVSASFLYDITKNVSIYVNYTHIENHSNEPLEKYADNLCTAGMYYMF